MNYISLICCFIFSCNFLVAQPLTEMIVINNELQLLKISDNVYIHISYIHDKNGDIPCNGLILTDNGKAFLFDTPNRDSTTLLLLNYLKQELHLTISGFICNDWHWDSMGGLAAIKKAGIPSYANEMTRTIAKKKNLTIPDYGFTDSLKLSLNNKNIFCYYLGQAHTKDNIVIWLPSEEILFADCMVKELKAKDLGFTGDGNLRQYPKTLNKVKNKFPNAKIVIPGHGEIGGMELVDHTIMLTR